MAYYIRLFIFVGLVVSCMFLSQVTTVFGAAGDLEVGSTGPDVVRLQTALEKNGFLVIPKDGTKGYFGENTKQALVAFQKSQGIVPAEGYFGAKTRAALYGTHTVTTPQVTVSVAGEWVSIGATSTDTALTNRDVAGAYEYMSLSTDVVAAVGSTTLLTDHILGKAALYVQEVNDSCYDLRWSLSKEKVVVKCGTKTIATFSVISQGLDVVLRHDKTGKMFVRRDHPRVHYVENGVEKRLTLHVMSGIQCDECGSGYVYGIFEQKNAQGGYEFISVSEPLMLPSTVSLETFTIASPIMFPQDAQLSVYGYGPADEDPYWSSTGTEIQPHALVKAGPKTHAIALPFKGFDLADTYSALGVESTHVSFLAYDRNALQLLGSIPLASQNTENLCEKRGGRWVPIDFEDEYTSSATNCIHIEGEYVFKKEGLIGSLYTIVVTLRGMIYDAVTKDADVIDTTREYAYDPALQTYKPITNEVDAYSDTELARTIIRNLYAIKQKESPIATARIVPLLGEFYTRELQNVQVEKLLGQLDELYGYCWQPYSALCAAQGE